MTRVLVSRSDGPRRHHLVPRLVEAGHEVVTVSRGQAKPIRRTRAWDAVEQLTMDRAAMEQDGSFGPAIRALKADIVIDMMLLHPESAKHLTEGLSGLCRPFSPYRHDLDARFFHRRADARGNAEAAVR